MTSEFTVLALAGLLQGVQFVLFAIPANRQLGTGYTMGNRDAPPPRQLTPTAARLQRAMNNHFESLILFLVAVVSVAGLERSSPVTAGLAWVYLAARVVYLPCYVLGLTPWRSIVFGIGFGASMVMMLYALLP